MAWPAGLPANFGEMVSHVSFLMQDLAVPGPALTSDQKKSLINLYLQAWTGEIVPRTRFVNVGFSNANEFRKAMDQTSLKILEVLECFDANAAQNIHGKPMEPVSIYEMNELHDEDTADSVNPTKWAWEREQDIGKTGSDTVYLWIHRRSDGTANVSANVRYQHPELSGDTDIADVTLEEVAQIDMLAALHGAGLAGRSMEWREHIMAGLSDKALLYVRKYKSILHPRELPRKEPV